MNYYCTLFDSNYLVRATTMIDSILRTNEEFIIYCYCFDKLSYDILNEMDIKSIVPILYEDIETEQLKQLKKERTTAEYCWTCTPFIIKHSLERYRLDEITYLDADLFFFKNPSILLNEFRTTQNSVMITEHRYTKKYDMSLFSGIYCVQFMTFKNDLNGNRVLNWWLERCLEWCYNRFENGKFGDQKYLDCWTRDFIGVYVLKNLGGGVAPWNIQQYNLTEGPKINGIDIVFYHFHNFSWIQDNKFDLGLYKLTTITINLIYMPYIRSLIKQFKLICKYKKNFTGGKILPPPFLKRIEIFIKRKLKGNYNIIKS